MKLCHRKYFDSLPYFQFFFKKNFFKNFFFQMSQMNTVAAFWRLICPCFYYFLYQIPWKKYKPLVIQHIFHLTRSSENKVCANYFWFPKLKPKTTDGIIRFCVRIKIVIIALLKFKACFADFSNWKVVETIVTRKQERTIPSVVVGFNFGNQK